MKKTFLTVIIAAGVFVGMFKGPEARQRWVSKMKTRFEDSPSGKQKLNPGEVPLDDFEIASFHNS